MPGNDSGPEVSGPAAEDAPSPGVSTDTLDEQADNLVESIARQLRRRREASWRLPPLHDGVRDPLDRLAGQ
jgi:hypothetical protein